MLTVTTNAVAAEDCPNESLTVRVKLTGALEVGVPETMPVLAASDSPLEGSPVAFQVRVPVPVAWKVKAYAEPTVAGAAVTCAFVVEIAGGAGLLIVSLSNNIFNVRNVALLRGDVMDFRPQHLRQCKSHRGLACSRRTDQNPRGLVRISRKFAENAFRLVQANEIGNSAWTILFRQRHRKRESCAHWPSLPSA